MPEKPKILFVTTNLHKYREAKSILKPRNTNIGHLRLQYPETQSHSLRTIAQLGAEYCFDKIQKPLFVEDSGFFVPVLKGFPGPYSSYVAKTIGCEGVLALAAGKKAFFESAVAYKDADKSRVFVGRVWGKIGREKRGEKGFGYDPVFFPQGRYKTFAEDPGYKNKVSHRKKALEKLADWLEKKTG